MREKTVTTESDAPMTAEQALAILAGAVQTQAQAHPAPAAEAVAKVDITALPDEVSVLSVGGTDTDFTPVAPVAAGLHGVWVPADPVMQARYKGMGVRLSIKGDGTCTDETSFTVTPQGTLLRGDTLVGYITEAAYAKVLDGLRAFNKTVRADVKVTKEAPAIPAQLGGA